ncbi:hypothetical protein QVD17_23395 [Tagetes erecta]|uniref:C2H2-type domain-containing protein n=1 Tax=Tagetes erecta TaxID=13708 RepID=A0AAD8NU12_TARER|nr:hypothetical protein QVD17_23395 [Tagetes erecta]
MDPTITQPTTTTTSGDDNDGGPKDPTTIIKRKRTKRQRPTNLTQSSTSYNAFNSSPASSSNSPPDSTTTEDEDTANCLILLSKGYNNVVTNNVGEHSGYKFNSKKYIQTSTDGVSGYNGIYVYECKTCGRTFASFQALGGHRASHKKPRINEFEKRKPPSYMAFSDEDEPPPSLQLNHRKSFSKLHDCGICGAEFNSGQALGGHMRRHRPINGNTVPGPSTNTTLSLVPYGMDTTVVTDDHDNHKLMNDGLCLDLDLNLPAPPETTVAIPRHDQPDLTSLTSLSSPVFKTLPSSVHLSTAPTLVDCNY